MEEQSLTSRDAPVLQQPVPVPVPVIQLKTGPLREPAIKLNSSQQVSRAELGSTWGLA